MPVLTEAPSTLFAIAALSLPGVGPVKVRSWLKEMQGRDGLEYEDLARAFAAHGREQLSMALDRAERVLEDCAKLQIHTLCLSDSNYPDALKRIADPPPVLYARGLLENLSAPSFAVIGTRKASTRGLAAAENLGYSLAQNGFCVVSGLALGIDAAGHRGALRAKGATVAVLAHGLHTIQPTSNKPLGLAILENGGTLVGEHPPGVPPRPAEFVRRNRIQSGLSRGSIVVESAEEGGAMHQARFTKEQGRILAVAQPDPIVGHDDFNYSGGRLLMRTMGAHPVAKPSDLLKLVVENKTTPGQGQLGL